MFDSLSNNLNKVFDKIRGRGVLTVDNINTAMREVRIALLEADVALPVAKDFIKSVKERAIGQEVIKSVSPAQMVIKIVQDHLEELLGSELSEINLNAAPPAVVMMVGLQGSGKTTTSGKIALRLKNTQKKKILLASLDIYRPAAQKQLEIIAQDNDLYSLPIIEGQKPKEITERALDMARREGFDVVMLDTAGRLHIDSELMGELKTVKEISNPIEILLVVDSLTGQDAVNVAKEFKEQIGVTGVVLTRIDGDARGGAALSMRSVTGCPIKYLGSGEKITELEEFHPNRIAGRILDMGDVVSLVEQAVESIDQEEAEQMAKKMQKGKFDFDDLAGYLRQMRKMGGLSGMMKFLPGMKGMKEKMDNVDLDDRVMLRQEAIILSMTKKERKFPKLINASRKKRIAVGAGMTVQDVNKLMKMHKQMGTMMKKMKKMDKKTLMRQGLGALGGKGMPDMGSLTGMGGGMPDMSDLDTNSMKNLLGKLPK